MIRWQIKVVCAVAVTLAAAAALGWFLSGRQSHAPSPANEITLDAAPTLPVPEAHSRMNPLHSNAPRDFPSRLSDALGLSDPQRRSIEFGTLFQEWLDEDSPSAVNWLRTMHRGNEFTEGLTLALNQMSPASPEQAVALANELASEPPEKHLFNLVFSEIAAKDPQRAVSLLDQTQGDARVNAVRALASAWSLSDSSAALDWAETLSPSQGRAAAIESVLSIMASSDPEAALRAAQLDLDPGELSAVIDQAIGPLLQKVDYATAKDLIEQLPTDALSTRAILEISRSLAALGPDEARSWISQLPDGQTRRAAEFTMLDLWTADDPDVAKQYVANINSDDDLMSATEHLAQRLAATDPAGAFEWVQSLASEDARERGAVSVASEMARTQPVAAIQWIKSWPETIPGKSEALKAALSYAQLSATAERADASQ